MSTPATQTTTSTCPECGGEITLKGKILAGELVHCPECSSELEVMSVNPIKLEAAPEVEEDWGE